MRTVEERAKEILKGSWELVRYTNNTWTRNYQPSDQCDDRIATVSAILQADREEVEMEFKRKLAEVMVEVCEFGEILKLFDMSICLNSDIKEKVL